MKRTAILLALVMAAGSTALAAGLSKQYKNWDRTPEAYFLTNAERAEWNKVQTDSDAQNFILDYKTKRGPDFAKMLNERVAVADKYFSSGETKGSETLRGKIIIVFGPPSGIEQTNGASGARGVDPNAAGGMAGGSGKAGASGGGVTMSSGGAGAMSATPARAQTPTMIFSYDAEHAPKAIGKPFKAEVNMISTTYQEPADAADLNSKFDAVSEASTHPEAAPKPPAPPAN